MTRKKVICIIFFLFFAIILYKTSVFSEGSLEGLLLWATKLVPVLLPFMALCSIFEYLELENVAIPYFYPILHKITGCSPYGSICIFWGLLCGFPMGSKITADYYKRGYINKNEAQTIANSFSFFSPGYLFGVMKPLLITLEDTRWWVDFLVLYGIPILYSRFKLISKDNSQKSNKTKSHPSYFIKDLFWNNIIAILLLGMYTMMASGIIYLLKKPFFSFILDINSGIYLILAKENIKSNLKIILILTGVSFQGICCFLQAGFFLSASGLSVKDYVKKHIFLTISALPIFLSLHMF